MTAQEYKENYKKKDLVKMVEVLNDIVRLQEMKLYKCKTKADKDKVKAEVTKSIKDIESVKEALNLMKKEEDAKYSESPLSFDETQLIKAFKETALGREGLLNDAFFSVSAGYKGLIRRGIVKEIEHFHHYGHLPNHIHYGLVDEIYPTSDKDWDEFRSTGYSNKCSFREFLEARERGETFSMDKMKSVIDDMDKLFRTKIKTDIYFSNYTDGRGCNSFWSIKEYIVSGLTGEELLEKTFVHHMNDDFISAKPIDKEWFKNILTKRQEYLTQQIKKKKKKVK